jgi:hypothetical protein
VPQIARPVEHICMTCHTRPVWVQQLYAQADDFGTSNRCINICDFPDSGERCVGTQTLNVLEVIMYQRLSRLMVNL